MIAQSSNINTRHDFTPNVVLDNSSQRHATKLGAVAATTDSEAAVNSTSFSSNKPCPMAPNQPINDKLEVGDFRYCTSN